MAEVSFETRPVTIDQEHIVLTLSLEEAAALHDAALHVGGSPHDSRRKYIDNIANALRSAELGRKVGLRRNDVDRSIVSGIYFLSPDEE